MMNKNSHLPQTDTITTQSRDGFANETVFREGFSGFVKLFSDSTNQMHEIQKSQTDFR